jgi:hypothetical protein
MATEISHTTKNGKDLLVLPFPLISVGSAIPDELLRSIARFRFTEQTNVVQSSGKGKGRFSKKIEWHRNDWFVSCRLQCRSDMNHKARIGDAATNNS